MRGGAKEGGGGVHRPKSYGRINETDDGCDNDLVEEDLDHNLHGEGVPPPARLFLLRLVALSLGRAVQTTARLLIVQRERTAHRFRTWV